MTGSLVKYVTSSVSAVNMVVSTHARSINNIPRYYRPDLIGYIYLDPRMHTCTSLPVRVRQIASG